MKFAIATDAAHPTLDDDGPALLEALANVGLVPTIASWTDRGVDWSSFDAVLLRTVWDYTSDLEGFLRWTRRIRRLINPGELVAWNAEKTYLRQLADCGIPTVETQWLSPGHALSRAPFDDFVVKPAVSAGARDTARFSGSELEEARALVELIHGRAQVAMLQPYLGGIDARGETALYYFGGHYSHAVRKPALLERGRVVDQYAPGFVEARTPSVSELELGEQLFDDLRSLGFDLPTYARVDLVPGGDGEPRLMELELIEPRLFLATSEGSAARYAEAVREALENPPS